MADIAQAAQRYCQARGWPEGQTKDALAERLACRSPQRPGHVHDDAAHGAEMQVRVRAQAGEQNVELDVQARLTTCAALKLGGEAGFDHASAAIAGYGLPPGADPFDRLPATF